MKIFSKITMFLVAERVRGFCGSKFTLYRTNVMHTHALSKTFSSTQNSCLSYLCSNTAQHLPHDSSIYAALCIPSLYSHHTHRLVPLFAIKYLHLCWFTSQNLLPARKSSRRAGVVWRSFLMAKKRWDFSPFTFPVCSVLSPFHCFPIGSHWLSSH